MKFSNRQALADFNDWQRHPHTETVVRELAAEQAQALGALIGIAKNSTDPKVVQVATYYSLLTKTLQGMIEKGEEEHDEPSTENEDSTED